MIEAFIIILLAAGIILALRSVIKNKGCSGDCGNCGGCKNKKK